MATKMNRLDFSSPSADLSTFKLLDLDGVGPVIKGGKQFARLFLKATGSADTDEMTIVLTLVDDGDRIASFEAVATMNGLTDADGLRLSDLLFVEGGGGRFDLMGAGSYGASESPFLSRCPVWLVGWTAKTGSATAVSVFYETSTEV